MTYSGGDGTCNSATVRIALCSICGWSKAGNNVHNWSIVRTIQIPAYYQHYRYTCSGCGNQQGGTEQCYDVNNNPITCINRAVCKFCGYDYRSSGHSIGLGHRLLSASGNTVNSEAYCGLCNTVIFNLTSTKTSAVNKKTVFTSTITPKSGTITSAVGGTWSYCVGLSVENSTPVISGNKATVTTTFNYTGAVNSHSQHLRMYGTINGIQYGVSSGIVASDDVTAPTINAPTISPAIGATFVQQRTITFSAVDTYSDLVYLGIAEQANGSNMVVPLGVGVKSGTTFTRSSVPLTLEAGTTAKTFYIIARDKIGNQSSRAFTISHTDMQAPSAPTVTGLEPNIWRQSKNVRVSTVDAGVGGVQIAFNGVADYKAATQSGTTFTRDLIFTGTVVTPQTRVFYLKDSLGNAREYSFQIGWLDNKAPTTPSYKTKLGVGDGKHAEEWPLNVEWISGTDAESGVSHVEYSYDNLQWVTGTVQKVEKTQTVYARTVDKVGNTSAVRAVAVLIDANRPEVGYG